MITEILRVTRGGRAFLIRIESVVMVTPGHPGQAMKTHISTIDGREHTVDQSFENIVAQMGGQWHGEEWGSV